MRKEAFPQSSGVYSITHIESGRRYIGSAKNIARRWYAHRCDLKKNIHDCPHLQRSYNKYGKKAFQYEVVEFCLNEWVILKAREQHWIDKFKGNLFNVRLLAEQFSGAFYETKESEPFRKAAAERSAAMWKNKPLSVRHCEYCGNDILTKVTDCTVVRWCSQRCRNLSESESGIYNETRTCKTCGKEFEVYRYRKTVTCSKSCTKRISSKLSIDDIKIILFRFSEGESIQVIADEYQVPWKIVWRIAKRDTHSDVEISPDVLTALTLRNEASSKRLERLSDEEIAQIKTRIANGDKQRDIANDFGINDQTVSSIKSGKRQERRGKKISPPNIKLTDRDIVSIRERLLLGEKRKELSKEFNVSTSHMWRIANMKNRAPTTALQEPQSENESIEINYEVDTKIAAIREAGEKRKAEGFRIHNSKLTVNQVKKIKRGLALGYRQSSLARSYKVSIQTISSIKQGRNYADIIPDPNPSTPLLPGF